MFKTIFSFFLLLAVSAFPASAKPPLVVASIKPLQSLVAMVMEGVGSPYLLVRNNASPHDYVLRPSDASTLEKADLVFWIGPRLETALARPLKTLAARAEIVAFADVKTLIRLPLLTGDGINMHFWLDPENAILMVQKIADELTRLDPDNGERYRQNALGASASLRDLSAEISAILKPVSSQKFITFHNAYRYFEKRFSLTALASITINPQTSPGVRRIKQIQQLIASNNVGCVFSEPQFSPRLINAISQGSGVKIGILDPLGANLEPGAGLYFQLLRDMALAMADCLKG
ncbi:Zinc ABC transporter, substrate-binding protein ZnuA [hydrothermal vent metagenome]|uniref:Zinc ABC transporter, substrate-binding protein ZnuA n=1 Tax=hydrothermal vent metagenome TaxID=652676 RepID=A0A3B0UP55_9ZZZZ